MLSSYVLDQQNNVLFPKLLAYHMHVDHMPDIKISHKESVLLYGPSQ